MLSRLRALLSLFVFVSLVAPTAACATAPAGSAFTNASTSIVIAAASRRRGTAIAPPSVVYDTSVGNGVDANGFTSLPLRAGGHRYFISSATGNNANGCTAAQSPTTPLATIAAGFACIPDNGGPPGNGDQILLAEGSTFNENMPWLAFKSGFSAVYPTVIESYDPADPTNEARYGRGDQRNARPVLNITTSSGNGGGPFSYLVIKGLAFHRDEALTGVSAIDLTGNNVTGGGNYLLIENDTFDNGGVSYSAGGDGTTTPLSHHLILRNNAFQDMWADNSATHVGCVYMQDNDSATVEDNVFYHCGWRIGGSRDDAASSAANGGSGVGGGPTVFNHPLYIQANASSIVRRNLFMDGAADGGIARGPTIVWNQNVSIRAPSGTGLGAGNLADYQADPNGSLTDAGYNLSLAAINLTTIGGGPDQRGSGFTLGNNSPGSRVHNNLLIDSTVETTSGNASTYSTTGDVFSLGNKSYTEAEFNKSSHWNLSGATINVGGTNIHAAYDNNVWDDPTSGTNTNRASVTFPNAYTEAGLYTAAGVTDYPTLHSLAFAHPENHYQRTLLSLAFAGYGMATAPTDTTAPTLTSPTGIATSGSTATIGVTTNDNTGKLYYELLTTGTAPNVSQIKMGLDGSSNAGVSPGSLVIAATGAKSVNLSGVPPGTYFAHFTHEDSAGNKSAAATSVSFILSSPLVWNGSADTPASSSDWLRSNGNLTINRNSTAAGFWAIAFASAAKTSGTIIFKVDAIAATGLVPSSIGVATSAETQAPGQNATGASIGYESNGNIVQGNAAVATGATYAPGDCLQVTKATVNVSFYKQTACTGSFVLQATVDTSAPVNGFGTVLAGAAFPAAGNGNGTGTQVTITDASGW